jgi:hypothetical protein
MYQTHIPTHRHVRYEEPRRGALESSASMEQGLVYGIDELG